MNAIVKTLKLSSKGQLTLPKIMRDALGSEFVAVSMDNGRVVIEPFPNLAGSLRQYARPDLSHEEAIDLAWQSAADDASRNS